MTALNDIRIDELERAVDKLSEDLDIPLILMKNNKKFEISCHCNRRGQVREVKFHFKRDDEYTVILSFPLDDPKSGTVYD